MQSIYRRSANEKMVLALFTIACLGVAFAILYETPSPFVHLGGDYAKPLKLKAGERISVYRNFHVTKTIPVVIARRMTKGDCSKTCTFIDLPSSEFTVGEGVYMEVKRDHIIPRYAEPGVWKLEFFTNWENIIGKHFTAPWPVLEFEVVQ